jgi:hypothetical protein
LPESGWRVEEINAPDILEILFDMYRILYRFDGKLMVILRVWPGAQPLHPRRLESE